MGDRLPDSAWRQFLEPQPVTEVTHSGSPPIASVTSKDVIQGTAKNFYGFDSLAPEVQVEALRMCEDAPSRLSHRKLLDILERHCSELLSRSGYAPAYSSTCRQAENGYEPPTEPLEYTSPATVSQNMVHHPSNKDSHIAQLNHTGAQWLNGGRTTDHVAAVAILAVGGRRLHLAIPVLSRLLESRRPALRGAAAAALLRLGWGVGLGHLTTTALAVLEMMAGVPLGDERSHGHIIDIGRRGAAPKDDHESRATGATWDESELARQMSAAERVPSRHPSFRSALLPSSPIASRQSSALRSPMPNFRASPPLQPLQASALQRQDSSSLRERFQGVITHYRDLHTAGMLDRSTRRDSKTLGPTFTEDGAESVMLPPSRFTSNPMASGTSSAVNEVAGQFGTSGVGRSSQAKGNIAVPELLLPPPSLPKSLQGEPLCASAHRPANVAPLSSSRFPITAPRDDANDLECEITRLTAEWDELSTHDPGAAIAVAIRLTRLKGVRATSRSLYSGAEAGRLGDGSINLPGAGHFARHAVAEQLVAINMLQALPQSLLPVASLLTLLKGSSHAVKRAALPLLRPSLSASPLLAELIDAALSCAEDPHTEHRAKRALVGLMKHGGRAVALRVLAQAEVRLNVLVDAAKIRHHEDDTGTSSTAIKRHAGAPTGQEEKEAADMAIQRNKKSERGHPSSSYARATRIRGLCGVVCETDGGEELAERLLDMSASVHDPEVSR